MCLSILQIAYRYKYIIKIIILLERLKIITKNYKSSKTAQGYQGFSRRNYYSPPSSFWKLVDSSHFIYLLLFKSVTNPNVFSVSYYKTLIKILEYMLEIIISIYHKLIIYVTWIKPKYNLINISQLWNWFILWFLNSIKILD